ncbi:hypothetical protein L7F22_025391 [Adiantum nelumboides]|nr:hypothetical protein [Adiantum nelumboides]
MSFLHPFSFLSKPANSLNNAAVPIERQSTRDTTHFSESHGSLAPYIPSPPRSMYTMDLNQSQYEEVIYDTQVSQHDYYDPIQSIHNDATLTPTESMTELHAELATQQRTCQHLNSRPENVGNKRRRKAQFESSTQAKNAAGRFHWDPKSTLILIEVKHAHDVARFHAGVGGKAKTSEEQWVDIASSMASSGAFVEWRVANDKWKRLSQIHKEIADWEKNIPSGKSTY